MRNEMNIDMVAPIATAIGSAIAAGIGGFKYGQSRTTPRAGGPSGVAGDGTVFVRLSAEDSDRVERIDSLLERLISLEEQTQSTLSRLGDLMIEARLEQANRHGELTGMLRVRVG